LSEARKKNRRFVCVNGNLKMQENSRFEKVGWRFLLRFMSFLLHQDYGEQDGGTSLRRPEVE